MKNTFHIITHTHWDREWHKTFEQFRFILVDLMDNLLNILEKDEDYKCFHLDGQTVILEDYLEMKPENRQRIEMLVKKRKLFIGPWYVLPDEFLVSGEAIIRNLLHGHAIAGQFGRVMRVGYIPDSFGHISQMPQIFQGFGIDNVILWRGFGGETGQEKSEYEWRAPDGTKALMIHLPEGGYARDFIATLNPDEISEKIESIFTKLLPRTGSPHLLMLQGSDHLWAFPQLPELVDFLNTRYPEYRFVHSSLEDFMEA
ncbi:alpha-mannosidase, partial [candidate division KSB1 bacterium]|nr:alpha-mannosidase [candidate division KSB1 bacterium]